MKLSAVKYANWKCTETAHLLLISQNLRKYNGHQTPVSFSCTTLPQEIKRSEKQYLALKPTMRSKMRVGLYITTI